jgi:hypothetical protein
VACGLEHAAMIRIGEMRRQQPDRGQRHGGCLEHLDNYRESSGSSRGFDPVIRTVLGEMQYLGAVRKKRGAAFAEIEATCIDFHQQPNYARRCDSLIANRITNLREYFTISQFADNRTTCIDHFGITRIVGWRQ